LTTINGDCDAKDTYRLSCMVVGRHKPTLAELAKGEDVTIGGARFSRAILSLQGPKAIDILKS